MPKKGKKKGERKSSTKGQEEGEAPQQTEENKVRKLRHIHRLLKLKLQKHKV